jgi:hypothetical protein
MAASTLPFAEIRGVESAGEKEAVEAIQEEVSQELTYGESGLPQTAAPGAA